MVAGNLYKIPIRIEVEWGSATFRDTLHEHGVVLDMDANVTTIWSASFTRGTNWGKTIPYPTLHSMSGYIEWSSPHGEYNPSGVGTATGIIPREDLGEAERRPHPLHATGRDDVDAVGRGLAHEHRAERSAGARRCRVVSQGGVERARESH